MRRDFRGPSDGGEETAEAPESGRLLQRPGMTPTVIGFLIRARNLSLLLTALLLVLLSLFGRRVSYEQSIRSFFAPDDPAVVAYGEASRTFGDDNFVFVVYDDPALFTPGGMDRIAELARDVGPGSVEGVLRVESLDAMPLFWQVDSALLALDKLPAFLRTNALNAAKKSVRNLDLKSNAMTVGGAVRSADAAGLADLKARVTAHPLFRGTLVDASGRSAAIVVRLKKTVEHNVTRTIEALRAKADAFAARHALARPAVVGPPVLLADGFRSIERDGRLLAGVGMVLIGLVTLSATRSLWWALVPILAGWVVWLATEAALAAFHLKLSLSGGPLVAQIIVLTMPAASHLAIHFRDDRRREADPRLAARSTLSAVTAPILWCAVTGAIGYGALIVSRVVPVQQFGVILGACTLLTALLVLAISPAAMLPPFRLEIPVRLGSTSRVSGAMDRLTGWVSRHPLGIVIGVFTVVVPVSLGMTRLEYESNYINAFKPRTRVVRDYHAVESRLGGIGLVELVVPIPAGETLSDATLGKIRSLERAVAAIPGASGPAASHVLSLATVLDPEGRLAALPEASRARLLASKLELIAASPQGELLSGFWNAEQGKTRLLVRILEQQPAPAKARTFDRALDLARAAFGPEAYLTGLSYLLTRTTEAIIVTQWATILTSTLGILLMLTLALRKPVLAVLALLPTLLSVALVLGLMGWMGVKLDLATALVASVALGLSVDDTFHCLLQFRRLRADRPFLESLFASYAVTGPGVLLSSLAVAVGFAALWFSEFAPFSIFGMMVGIATSGSTLGNLILLPACLTLGDRLRARLRGVPEPVASAGGS